MRAIIRHFIPKIKLFPTYFNPLVAFGRIPDVTNCDLSRSPQKGFIHRTTQKNTEKQELIKILISPFSSFYFKQAPKGKDHGKHGKAQI